MKKALKITGISVVSIIVLLIAAGAIYFIKTDITSKNNLALLGEEAPTITVEGQEYRDLNKNNKLDIYENPSESVENRVNDLVDQMTIEEKAGMMFVTIITAKEDGSTVEAPVLTEGMQSLAFSMIMPTNSDMIAKRKMNSFNILVSTGADKMARYNNNIQKMAERTRLGIPITVSTDPRHTTEFNPGTAIYTPAFSQWPSSLGLAATRDTNLVREFGDIARQEYLASGIRLALHPMADLNTEPRWSRGSGTFGEDAYLSAMMTKAYILGFQGDALDQNSVACMTKHFSGGGPQADGEDPHFPYGTDQVYPGNNFDYHVIPFTEGAFKANTAQIMPYYGIPVGQTDEDVAFGFNKAIITQLLRDSLGFTGVVCTDWGLISDMGNMPARAWGVEDLTRKQRVAKVIEAGCDQFGGESCPELIVELVKEGTIDEDRIDVSIKRILRDKFKLGLFDNPYVDEKAALKIAGKKEFVEKGRIAQAKSMILLQNDETLLPLKKGTKIYAHNLNHPETVNAFGTLVKNIEDADVVLTRIYTPFEPRNDYFLEPHFNAGRTYYTDEELKEITDVISQKPSIVIANLERPTILTEVLKESTAMFAEFGTTDEVLMKVLFGEAKPEGKLPFELPSSWDAILNQLEDVPYDSKDPLFPYGFGLSYN